MATVPRQEPNLFFRKVHVFCTHNSLTHIHGKGPRRREKDRGAQSKDSRAKSSRGSEQEPDRNVMSGLGRYLVWRLLLGFLRQGRTGGWRGNGGRRRRRHRAGHAGEGAVALRRRRCRQQTLRIHCTHATVLDEVHSLDHDELWVVTLVW